MTQKPDVAVARSMMDTERLMGIEPIESLLARREEYVKEAADLRARYGSFGTWDSWRKSQLCTIKVAIRAQMVQAGQKVTEAAIDDAAHAHDDYVSLITEATEGRTELTILEAKIEGIDAVIRRGDAVARYVTAEARL